MGLSLDKLVFDPADAASGSQVGAFILAGDGSAIAKQSIAASNWLQVASALFDGAGGALTSHTGALDAYIAGQAADLNVNLTNASVAVTSASTLDVNITNASVAVTEAAFGTVKSTTQSIGTTAAQLAATALSGRKYMIVQNKGAKPIYIGASGVTTSAGTEVAPGGSLEVKVSDTCAIYAISAAAGQDVRVFEAA
jgi:hypothetical protein